MNDERKIREVPEEPKIKGPLDFFFELGDWATKGDPAKQQDFSYYMIWILFLAFVGLFTINLYRFVVTIDFSYLIWALIGFAISSLQYFNLKSFYQMRKARGEFKIKNISDDKVEDVDSMLKGFKK